VTTQKIIARMKKDLLLQDMRYHLKQAKQDRQFMIGVSPHLQREVRFYHRRRESGNVNRMNRQLHNAKMKIELADKFIAEIENDIAELENS